MVLLVGSAGAQEPGAEPPACESTPWVYTGGPAGGLGYDVRMAPRDPEVMYVTDAWAGVFKSLDGGATWFPSSEGISARVGPSGDGSPVFGLTIDPKHPDTPWAGTQFSSGAFRSDTGRDGQRPLLPAPNAEPVLRALPFWCILGYGGLRFVR